MFESYVHNVISVKRQRIKWGKSSDSILERIFHEKENKIVELKDKIYPFQKESDANKKELATQGGEILKKKASWQERENL